MVLALVSSGGLIRRHQQWVCIRDAWHSTLRDLPTDTTLPDMSPAQRDLLEFICLAEYDLTQADLNTLVPPKKEEDRNILSSLVRRHLVRIEGAVIQPMTPTVRQAVRNSTIAATERHLALATRLLDATPDEPALAYHLLGCEDATLVGRHGAAALRQLGARDRHEAATVAMPLWQLCPTPNNAAATLHALIGGGRVEDAIALGETLIDDKPETTSPSLLSAYAKACLEVPDRVSAALSAIQAARQQRPNSIDIEDLLIEAKAHFKLEDNTQAIEVASLSSRPPRDEQRLGYWLALRGVEAQALESAGRVSEAIERLKRVPTSLGNGLPARTSLDSTMGRLLWRSGQQREAAVWWERAVSGEGLSALNKARLLNNAACALYQVGDRGGAVQRWEDTYARFDRMRATLDMVRVAINLCVGYRELDRSDRAKAYGRWAIEGAAELNEAELQTVATGNLGDAFRDAGDHESAQQLYETAWGLACASELTLDKAEGSRRLLHLAV
jgi:tetratricopeptide (TPR) repeat protein